jgi:outer membrane protein TolC
LNTASFGSVIWLATAASLSAQPAPLSLRQAVEQALRNYPSIRVSQEEASAAAAGIRLARAAYLPRVDATAQANRATRNNVFGMLLPQSTLPSISGPVLGTNNFGTAWGSAVGALVTWEPFDFGQRQAALDAAAAGRSRSDAAVKRTEFEVAVASADAYLTLLAAQETVRAAQAGVERAETTVKTTEALVRADLRPGADASRAAAELAAARTQLIQARQAVDVGRAELARFTGGEPAAALATSRLLGPAPDQPTPNPDLAANPYLAEQRSVVDQTQAQLRVLERSYFPKFSLQAAAYARGTSAEVDGRLLGGVNGLAPNHQNYAIGFSVNFNLMELPALRARQAAQSAQVRAQEARSRQLAMDLKARWQAALATVEGARRTAANMPAQLAAARAALQQAGARYQAGLGVIGDVADAQRLLAQSEIDEALARLSVWRGLLGLAVAAGDIQPFVTEASE